MPYISTPEFQAASADARLAKNNADRAINRMEGGLTPNEFSTLKTFMSDGILTDDEKTMTRPILARLQQRGGDPLRVRDLIANFRLAVSNSNRAAAARDQLKVDGQASQWVPGRPEYIDRREYVDRPVFVERPIYRDRNFGAGAHTWDGRSIGSDSDIPGDSLKHRFREAGKDALVDALRRRLNGY